MKASTSHREARGIASRYRPVISYDITRQNVHATTGIEECGDDSRMPPAFRRKCPPEVDHQMDKMRIGELDVERINVIDEDGTVRMAISGASPRPSRSHSRLSACHHAPELH